MSLENQPESKIYTETLNELCLGCVYYPPNLPKDRYPVEDWLELQEKSCSFDYQPGDPDCLLNRKTSCSVVDLS